ncbi:Sensor_kinase_SpoOB-type, alpha-helical domain [Thermoactinomyces sp. DSM 45891]|uniref:sensor histidine kinase n=1 Tax=Thermoactinomyces sp. DSM 45891 TaxID=1761907 RepID=UPI00091854F1|nr:ATP-binding protein [Thermoactinomyces sp. DSM 45891]SFX41952.1 Sensor_kinase_SpoOB-type, alpha-helical domain [Thermoactinomyces sp. DSM 45891]
MLNRCWTLRTKVILWISMINMLAILVGIFFLYRDHREIDIGWIIGVPMGILAIEWFATIKLSKYIKKRIHNELHKELSQVHEYMESMRAKAHEFQNTLYAISGLIQLQSYDEAISLIQQESQLHQDQILVWTKKVKDKRISAILIGYYNHAKEMKVALQIDPATYIPEHINILNITSFISLLGNLVLNAMEELQKVQGERKIRIFMECVEDTLVLEVEDNGFGIRDEMFPFIFEKGFSTKSITRSEKRGFGLWKVKQIVEEHGGTVLVERGNWDGTLFAITLPLKGDVRLDRSVNY